MSAKYPIARPYIDVSVRLSENTVNELETLAQREGIARSVIVRSVIEHFVNNPGLYHLHIGPQSVKIKLDEMKRELLLMGVRKAV